MQNTTKNTSNTAIANARKLQDLTRNVISTFALRGPTLDKLLLSLPLLSVTAGPAVSKLRAGFTVPNQVNYQGAPPRPGAVFSGAGTAAITEEEPAIEERILPSQLR